jgi:molybdate transport system ATP-binding protein
MALLARALIKNPSLLVLDEPCQGLDEEQAAHFKELIGAICQAFDSTLIYVSHYPAEIPSCIDRHLRLEQGAVAQFFQQ